MLMIIVTEKADADVVSEARSIVLVHQPDNDNGGMCSGCYEFACSFAWWPCPQVRWAQRVLATGGGGDQP